MAGEEPFPDSVKDFVFDLHDAARRSFIPSEQQSLYMQSFREITSKVRERQSSIECNNTMSHTVIVPSSSHPYFAITIS